MTVENLRLVEIDDGTFIRAQVYTTPPPVTGRLADAVVRWY